jgi:hypothetical protein
MVNYKTAAALDDENAQTWLELIAQPNRIFLPVLFTFSILMI